MSTEIEMLETIDYYLYGNLSDKQKMEFDTKIKQDEVLRTMFEKQSAIHLLVVEAGLNDIRNLMQNDLSKASTKKKNSSVKWLGGGLLVVLGISVAGYLYNNREKVKPRVELDKPKSSELVTQKLELGKSSENQETKKIEPQKTIVEINKVSMKNMEIIHLQHVVQNPEVANISQKDVINAVAIEPKNKTDLVVQQDSCSSFNPNVSFETKASVANASTGEIKCLSKEVNLKYRLNAADMDQNTFFTDLAAGTYKVTAENRQGCKWEKEGIVVKTTFCIENKKNTFNAVLEADYEMPIAQNQRVDIIVYNKQMLNVASFNNVEELRWDGRINGGAMAEPTLHKIEIRYKSGEYCFYSLTIFSQ